MTKPTLYPESGFSRLRIDLAYDGSNYFGWAKQSDQRSVQEGIESALSKIARVNIETVVAGRTDAGVHATGQVMHVDVPQSLEIEDLVYKLNRILDEDIRIMKIEKAPEAFHARFSALRRHYNYKILDNNAVLSPLNRFDVAPWYKALEIDLMNQASSLVIGKHDFAAFSKFREGATTLRTLEKFSWHRDAHGYLIAELVADAFCYSMVRSLVGAAVCVGDQRFAPEWMKSVLLKKERVSDSLVFPARGLTLIRVDYPDDARLLLMAAQNLALEDGDLAIDGDE